MLKLHYRFYWWSCISETVKRLSSNKCHSFSTGRVCYLLVDPVGPFADCHKEISYAEFYKKCIQDGCRCEGCLCNVIAGYAKACAAKDIDVNGWRNSVKPCSQGELNNFMIL